LSLPPDPINMEEEPVRRGKNIVIMPIASPTRMVASTLRYAKAISSDIIAVHVVSDEEAGRKVEERWKRWNPGIRLVALYSPYRLVIQPLIDYIEDVDRCKQPEDYITVLIPEFETRKWWHRLLHNQTGWVLRTLLILKENVIVTTIPYHLKK
jgi:hypothetical protein